MDKLKKHLPLILWLGCLLVYGNYLNVARLSLEYSPVIKSFNFDLKQTILFTLGIISCILGYFIKIKMTQSISFYNYKLVKLFYRKNIDASNFESSYFYFLCISIGLYNTSAIYSLISFLGTPNLYILIISFSIMILFHLFSFPSRKQIEELLIDFKNSNGI
jgi:hypothetical protein